MLGSRSRENGGVSTVLNSVTKSVTHSFVVRAFSRDKDSGPRSSRTKAPKHVTLQQNGSSHSLDQVAVAPEKSAIDTKAKSESKDSDIELAKDAGGK
jgi:hypothetical protein